MKHAGLIACMGIVASLFVLGIGLGYELNEGISPLRDWMAPAGGLLLVSVGTLIWVIRKHAGDPPPLFPHWYRQKPAPQPRFTPEQLAYAKDPTRLATCVHLQPVEKAMREAGIKTVLRYGVVIEAQCRVDPERLSLEPPTTYIGNFPGDRPYDPESALFSCAEHSSVIGVIHPDEAKPDTPVFPA